MDSARSLQIAAPQRSTTTTASSPAARLLFDVDVSVVVNAVADYAANSSTSFATGCCSGLEGAEPAP